MRRACQDPFKKDIKVSKDIGAMLPSPLDYSEFEGLTLEEITNEPPEQSQLNERSL